MGSGVAQRNAEQTKRRLIAKTHLFLVGIDLKKQNKLISGR